MVAAGDVGGFGPAGAAEVAQEPAASLPTRAVLRKPARLPLHQAVFTGASSRKSDDCDRTDRPGRAEATGITGCSKPSTGMNLHWNYGV